MKKLNYRSFIRKKWVIILLLLLLTILLFQLKYYPFFVERYYSETIYIAVCYVLHPVFNIIPISIGDLLYSGLIISLIIAIIRILRFLFTGQFKRAGGVALKTVIGFQITFLLFYLLWGLNYARPSAALRLNLQDTSYTIEDMAAVTATLIDSANANRKLLGSHDLVTSNREIYNQGVQAIKSLPVVSAELKSYFPKVKSSLFSHWLGYMGTSGYYNPFTGEAQINAEMPIFNRPFTACHEMAHQMGFGREDEANFVGFLAASRSPKRLLRYSAYYVGLEEFMRSLSRRDTIAFKDLKHRISPEVIKDFKADSAYWVGYQGKAWLVSGVFYDQFLKANNQPAGMRTYNRMIRLTMAYYIKNKLFIRPKQDSLAINSNPAK